MRRPGSLLEKPTSDDPRPGVGALLEIRGLKVSLRDQKRGADIPVLRDVSFDLAQGETVGLVGESGSGKSMTCRAIIDMLPAAARITAGEIRIDGDDILSLPPRDRAALRGSVISMIPQDPLAALNPVLRVGDQIVETIRRHRPMSKREARDVALDMLERVKVSEAPMRLRQYPHELSGGIRQRVVSVIALAGQPRLVLADEPTTALDVTVQRAFVETLMELKESLGFALVFVTHDLALISLLADRINVMYAGGIVERGPAADVLGRPGHPYTRGLLEAIPRLGATPVRPRAIPGDAVSAGTIGIGCPFAPRCAYAHDACTKQAPPEIAVGPGQAASCWALEDER